jgi:hypothetical protein
MRSWLLSLLAAAGLAQAQSVRILTHSSPLAGYQYHEGTALWDQLQVGDVLMLVREAGNPHDANAVRVEWRGHLLGYLPRAENRSVAAEMDRGTRLTARIGELRPARNPWQRLRVDIFVVL